MTKKRNRLKDEWVERLMTELNIPYNCAYVRVRRMREEGVSIEDYLAAGGVLPRIAKHRSEVREIMNRLGLTRKQAAARRYYCMANNIDVFENASPIVVIQEVPTPKAHRAVVLTVKDGKWQRASEYEANNYIKTAIISAI